MLDGHGSAPYGPRQALCLSGPPAVALACTSVHQATFSEPRESTSSALALWLQSQLVTTISQRKKLRKVRRGAPEVRTRAHALKKTSPQVSSLGPREAVSLKTLLLPSPQESGVIAPNS